ncbi:MAG: cobaltochelatase subunit CobN, partial [Muribaculaceae bacterium]|nr:cobaltochelatase subunit CobN [Muribaculaceae bacterium]
PISLDHVYEFTGALSLAATSINGKEPDAVLADYRNSYLPRLQNAKEAVAVETRATLLNPEYIKARMKGDATTAQMFGKIFRNIFGWSAMRPSALSANLYDELYDMYITDSNGLGIEEYFDKVNPVALQEMTATMLESARKGFWNADSEQLAATAKLHARLTERHGAPCTEFVCANAKLQEFTSSQLSEETADKYRNAISEATAQPAEGKVLKEERVSLLPDSTSGSVSGYVIAAIVGIVFIILLLFIIKKRKERQK